MPALIEHIVPRPLPLRPPLGNHCRVCGACLKGAGRRRNRYCTAHSKAAKSLWERKHRTDRREYHRQWMRDFRQAKRQEEACR